MSDIQKVGRKIVFWPCRQLLGRFLLLLVVSTCVVTAYYLMCFQTRLAPFVNVINTNLVNMDRYRHLPSDNSRDQRAISIQSPLRKINTSSEDITGSQNMETAHTENVDSHLDARYVPYIQREARQNNVFQTVNNQGIWVYSAYFDWSNKGRPLIKIIGIAPHIPVQIYCHLQEMGRLTVIVGTMFGFSDSHTRVTNFSSTSFQCNLQLGSRPDFVSLSTNIAETPTNHLSVMYPGPRLRKITVCHPALHNPYNEPSEIIQAIEINRALGADHTFIYNHSVSKETNLVLKQYEEDGVLTILQWHIPNHINAWYYAQAAAINDCIYRNRNVSQYVAILDLDEFVIPVNQTSWIDLIKDINDDYYGDRNHKKPPLGAMAFESCIFNKKPSYVLWKQIKRNFSITQEEEDIFTRHALMPFLYLERSEPSYKFPVRSKYFVRPELVVTAGIHDVSHQRESAKIHVTSQKMAILNHYSITPMMVYRRVLDVSVLRLKQLFFPRLQMALSRFASIF